MDHLLLIYHYIANISLKLGRLGYFYHYILYNKYFFGSLFTKCWSTQKLFPSLDSVQLGAAKQLNFQKDILIPPCICGSGSTSSWSYWHINFFCAARYLKLVVEVSVFCERWYIGNLPFELALKELFRSIPCIIIHCSFGSSCSTPRLSCIFLSDIDLNVWRKV